MPPQEQEPPEAAGHESDTSRLASAERHTLERIIMTATAWSAVSTRMAVLMAFVYVLLRIAAPYVHVASPPVSSALAVVVFMFLQVALVYYTTRAPLAASAEAGAAVVAVSFWVLFAYVLGTGSFGAERYAGQLAGIRLAGAHTAMILAAAFVGMLVSRIIRDRNMVLPVAIVAAIVDVLTVFRGPVGRILEGAPDLVAKVSVGIPQLGVATAPAGSPQAGFISFMGPGDFVFLGIFMAGIWRFRMNAPTTFWAIYAFSLIGMLVISSPSAPYVPGLPFIAGALLLANFHEFRLTRAERFALLYAAIAAAAVFALLALPAWLSPR